MRMAPIPIVQRLIQIGIRYAGGGKRLGAALPCLVASTILNNSCIVVSLLGILAASQPCRCLIRVQEEKWSKSCNRIWPYCPVYLPFPSYAESIFSLPSQEFLRSSSKNHIPADHPFPKLCMQYIGFLRDSKHPWILKKGQCETPETLRMPRHAHVCCTQEASPS